MKRRILSWLLIGAMLLGLCACGKGEKQPVQQPQPKALTLMIYMIGSDLESKSGAASDDLEEIRTSGVDLTAANVIVCAGGCEKWRSDAASADKNTVLQLTENGFEPLETWDAASMGDSKTLTQFLDYGVKSVPAESYALILWDHGNGPVMGYGKDTLHEKDALTLPEMRDALEASPFGKDNKLAWVGFDACLMASAELACIWDDYADYLVASQEVEPAFGWQYSFLKDAGKTDTPALMDSLTKTYLAACEDYYAEKGYSGRDTTLSCMDLSKAAAVEDAIDALFTKAAADVDAQYNRLASRRVNTRALGRATTGSEYDLVDLNDMAAQLAAYYPDEAAVLQDAVSAMVVSNETNADGLSGVSLYYPFFNKYYYEDSWEAAYAALDLFPAYHDYLARYGETWLGEQQSLTDAFGTPTLTATGEYTLQLTDAQADQFAYAYYHILSRQTDQLYRHVFTSQDVTFDSAKKTLTARFNGSIIYIQNNYGWRVIPDSKATTTDENGTHISVYGVVEDLIDPSELDIDKRKRMQTGWFHLVLDPATEALSVCSFLAKSDDPLEGGKTEELDLDEWDSINLFNDIYRMITWDDSGRVLPFTAWPNSDWIGGSYLELEDGLQFIYAPLMEGDYAIQIVIEDTQGRQYATMPTPIDCSDWGETWSEPESADPVEVAWSAGDAVTLLEQDDVTVRMLRRETEYGNTALTMELQNDSDRTVMLEGTGYLIANGTLDCSDNLPFAAVTAKPGETVHWKTGDSERKDDADLLFAKPALLFSEDYLPTITSLQFSILLKDLDTHTLILDEQPILVRFSGDAVLTQEDMLGDTRPDGPNQYRTPCLGALANEQILVSNENMELRLLGFGTDPAGYGLSGSGFLKITNRTDRALYFEMKGIALNGITFDCNSLSQVQVAPGTSQYVAFYQSVYDSDLELTGITGIQDLQLRIRTYFRKGFHMITDESARWYPVSLSERAAEAGSFQPGDTVLYEKDGVRITLLNHSAREAYFGTNHHWYFAIENNTGEDIKLEADQFLVNGTEVTSGIFMYAFVGAHQRSVGYISADDEGSVLKELSFRLLLETFDQGRILNNASNDTITLTPQ